MHITVYICARCLCWDRFERGIFSLTANKVNRLNLQCTHKHTLHAHSVSYRLYNHRFWIHLFYQRILCFIRWRNIYKHLTALSCTYSKIHSNKFVLVNNPPSPNSSFLCHKYRKNGYVTSFLLGKKCQKKEACQKKRNQIVINETYFFM